MPKRKDDLPKIKSHSTKKLQHLENKESSGLNPGAKAEAPVEKRFVVEHWGDMVDFDFDGSPHKCYGANFIETCMAADPVSAIKKMADRSPGTAIEGWAIDTKGVGEVFVRNPEAPDTNFWQAYPQEEDTWNNDPEKERDESHSPILDQERIEFFKSLMALGPFWVVEEACLLVVPNDQEFVIGKMLWTSPTLDPINLEAVGRERFFGFMANHQTVLKALFAIQSGELKAVESTTGHHCVDGSEFMDWAKKESLYLAPGLEGRLAPHRKEPKLSDVEKEIIAAIGKKARKGEAIASHIKRNYSGFVKATLANLVKREILISNCPGYRVSERFSFLLYLPWARSQDQA